MELVTASLAKEIQEFSDDGVAFIRDERKGLSSNKEWVGFLEKTNALQDRLKEMNDSLRKRCDYAKFLYDVVDEDSSDFYATCLELLTSQMQRIVNASFGIEFWLNHCDYTCIENELHQYPSSASVAVSLEENLIAQIEKLEKQRRKAIEAVEDEYDARVGERAYQEYVTDRNNGVQLKSLQEVAEELGVELSDN